MGMSTSVVGIKPPDETWYKMKQIWDSCKELDVDIPEQVGDFFNWEDPNDLGVIVEDLGNAVHEYQDEYRSGYVIIVDRLPKDVKMIRFTNSW